MDKMKLVTRSQIGRDLQDLGVRAGMVVMLHAAVRQIGWVVGGPEEVLHALLETLTPSGTLMMYVSWEDDTENWCDWSSERQASYLAECPPFNPLTSRAKRQWSILTEYLRTMPGAFRSANPCASMAAIGARAEWITRDHPLQYGYGPGSPLAKLCEAEGYVLLLGAPLDTVTLLHHSEHVAAIANKRTVRYKVPVLEQGECRWIEVEEFDTAESIVDGKNAEEYFPAIMNAYLSTGMGKSGLVGDARSYLFDAHDLNQFAISWLERELNPKLI